MKTVLFLSDYEDKDEFESVFIKLKKYNINGILAKPKDITITSSGSVIAIFFKGKKIQPSLLIGYSYEEDLLPAMRILNTASAYGIPVLNNSDTLFNGQNKEISSAILNMANGVRHLPYYKFENIVNESDLDGIDFPIVAKPLRGACGKGLQKFDSFEAFHLWVNSEQIKNDEFYVQPYISKHLNRDFRVVVVNYNACYAYARKDKDGGWITNMTKNGIGTIIPLEELDPELINMSELAARAVKAPFCGIDIALDENKSPFIIEANTCPTIKISKRIPEASDAVELAFAKFINESLEKRDEK